jgi:hypothetical protein
MASNRISFGNTEKRLNGSPVRSDRRKVFKTSYKEIAQWNKIPSRDAETES